MVPYNKEITSQIEIDGEIINSFIDKQSDINIDWNTVDSFSSEWDKFDNFTPEEIEQIGNDYFDILPLNEIRNARALDVGCGSGRWSKYLADRVKSVEAIDPSLATLIAHKMLREHNNVRVSQASVESLPFDDGSFDLVISLGVLHHIPNTALALKRCVSKIKKGGIFLVYLYYNLDNRGFSYKLIFQLSTVFRKFISRMPARLKKLTCDLIAFTIYWPLSGFSGALKYVLNNDFYKKIPLSYYHDKTFKILRNDALDRFGTPLEQRFSRKEINKMMIDSGLRDIQFSKKAPFWHAMGYKI